MKKFKLLPNTIYLKKCIHFKILNRLSFKILALVLFATAMQNLVAQTWSSSYTFLARAEHTATLLSNGKVLLAGGYSNGGYLNTCDLFDPSSGTWTTTGAMSTGRYAHTAVLLPNGKVLVSGGYDNVYGATTSCEIYDPSSGTWSSTGSMINIHIYSTVNLLPNGKVLVSGGYDNYYGYSTNCEIYDPSSGTWSSTGSLSTGRQYHTSTLLSNGKVLVAGGYDNYYGYTVTCELYDPSSGTWSNTGSLATGRYLHTATLLPDGKVMIAGGYDNYYGNTTVCELYDPSSGTWSSTGSMTDARNRHTATLLSNGKVLVAAGYGYYGYMTSCELFDPSSGTWSATGSMTDGRYSHTSTLLSNGKVLTIGGWGNYGISGIWETYNPTSGSWETSANVALGRYFHTSTVLQNGKVLVAGGYGPGGYLTNCQLYDPTTDTWTNTGSLAQGRYVHTATLLPNGKVLVSGGYNNNYGVSTSCELYDPSSGTWSSTGSMTESRYYHTATLLPNGKVLASGGYNNYGYSSGCELYDPSSGTWSSTGSMSSGRYVHTATLLPNGKVLVAGGYDNYYLTTSCELYDPSSGTWSSTGSLSNGHYYHISTLLSTGKVLVAGGHDNYSGPTSICELYDPSSGTWSSTGSMSNARYLHAAALLSNGNVLVGGGYNNTLGVISESELYDPSSGSWSATGSMVNARYVHSFTLLPNGKVLSVGGYSNGFLGGWELYGASVEEATALNFDGTDDYVSINNTLGNFSDDFTIEMNIRTTEADAYFLSKRGYCSNDYFISMQTVSGKLGFEIDNGGSNYVGMSGTSIINDNSWHHVAVTRKSGDIKLYVDGNLEATDYSTADNTSNYTLTLGASVCNGQNVSAIYSGDMDEIRFWSRAVSECELKQHKSCELSGSQTGLIAYYKLNQGYVNTDNTSITTITDDAGSNTGTLENFARTGTTSNFVEGNVSGTCGSFTELSFTACPGDIYQNNTDGSCTAVINYTATAEGTPSPDITYTFTGATTGSGSGTGSGSTFNFGTTEVTLTATNSCGTVTCKFKVVVDNKFYFDYSLNTLDECSPVTITWHGGCSAWNVNLQLINVNTFTVYTTLASNISNNGTYTWTLPACIPAGDYQFYIEEVSRTTTWLYGPTFTINSTPPTITTQASDQTVECDGAGNTSALNSWLTNNGGATATDICGNVTWSNDYTSLSDDCGATGSAMVTFTATDACGNKSTTLAKFIIKDTQAPTITTDASGSTVECDGSGNTTELNVWLANHGGAAATDACGGVTWSNDYSSLSDDCGATGSALVTFTATDACGNKSTTSAKFSIVDKTAPAINCPSKITKCGSQAVSFSASATDNCGTPSISYSPASGSTFNIGTTTVTATATDACGNKSSCNFDVVINPLPTVSITQGVQPTFCQGGSIVLSTTVNESVSYLWSNSATTNTISVNASGNYSVTVTNGNGCTASASTSVNYDATSLLSSYTIIATDEVELKEKSQVQTGGVGALGCNEGEIEVDGNSKITGSTTFAKAKKIKVTGGSTVTNQYASKLTLDLPDFQYNPNCDFECKSKNHNHCDSECKDKNHNHCKSSCKEGNHNHCSHKNCKGKNDVTVGSNKSVTLTDDVFGKIAIGKGSTVTFTQPVIYMKELKTSEGVTIKFTEACVVIMVCDEVELKDDNTFNSTEKSVVLYVEDEFKAKKNSTINASIYSLEEIKVEANNNNLTYMKGLFIAEKIKSNYAYWNWNTTCGNCTNLNKKSLFATDEAGLIDPTQISVNIYPNPNKGNFGIDIVTNKVGELKLSVIDLLGRTVYSETQMLNGPVFVPISLTNVANGQYLVRAEINGQLFTKMILINKQ